MAYDHDLAARVRQALPVGPELTELKMFGGVCYCLNGNMACGVHGSRLIVRLGKERQPAALTLPHTRPFDLTGRAMAGWIMVEEPGCANEEDLADWVQQGLEFARALPPK